MTPLEALTFLDNVAAKAPLERNIHAQAQLAVQILKEAIDDTERTTGADRDAPTASD